MKVPGSVPKKAKKSKKKKAKKKLEGASLVGIEDPQNWLAATNVQDALNEIMEGIDNPEQYTVLGYTINEDDTVDGVVTTNDLNVIQEHVKKLVGDAEWYFEPECSVCGATDPPHKIYFSTVLENGEPTQKGFCFKHLPFGPYPDEPEKPKKKKKPLPKKRKVDI